MVTSFSGNNLLNYGINKKKITYRNSNAPSVYYSTLSFTYTYRYDEDTVYFAHSVPYTYTSLTHYLNKISLHPPSSLLSRTDTIATTQIGTGPDTVFFIFTRSIFKEIKYSVSQSQTISMNLLHIM